MELLALAIDFVLHIDRYIESFVQSYGAWVYALLFVIVFIETGLVIWPFLPGDSLLFMVGLFVAKRIGYDLARGRLDKTHHPFCTTLSAGDVRITTRVDERDIGQSLFSILHEAGHAMYEQGNDPAYEGTPLAGGTSWPS